MSVYLSLVKDSLLIKECLLKIKPNGFLYKKLIKHHDETIGIIKKAEESVSCWHRPIGNYKSNFGNA